MNVHLYGKLGMALLCLTVFVPASQSVEVSTPGEAVPATPLEEISVPFPLLGRHLVFGYAEVLFVVDEWGVPGDFVVLKDTNPVFSLAVIQTIRGVTYEPVRVNDKAIPSRVIFQNHFYFQGGAALRHATEKVPTKKELAQTATVRVHAVEELDQPLEAIDKVALEYPEALLESSPGGGVLVEFYVAEDGTVRAPAIISSSHAMLSELVLEAIGKRRFNSPRVSGKPVTVVTQQKFSFR
jgi:TonB family protein